MKKNIALLIVVAASIWSSSVSASYFQFQGKNKLLAYGGGQAYACTFSSASKDLFGLDTYTYDTGMCLGGTGGIQLGDFNGGMALEFEYNVASGNGKSVSGTSWALRNRTYDGFARGQNGFEGMYWHGGLGSDKVANAFFGGAGVGYRTRSSLMYELEIRYNMIDTFDSTNSPSPYAVRAKVMYGINML